MSKLADCPYVRGDWVDEYLGLESGWYGGLYRFMVRVAMSARARGYDLTPEQVADLARELDRRDGNWYQDRDLNTEAKNALAWASAHAGIAQQDDPGSAYGPSGAPHAKLQRNRLAGNSLPPVSPLRGIAPYDFDDLLFAGRGGANPKPAFQFLARQCIAFGDSFWVRTGDRWAIHSKQTARAALIQQFQSVDTQPTITVQDIKDFLADGIVRFHGTGVFPGAPEFVWFQGHRYVNEWVDDRVRPDFDVVPEAETLLRIMRENLCGLDPVPFAEMVLECAADRATIFTWVMHWIASIYLRPGHHIGVALWFVGPNMGIGKGTIVGVLRSLLGTRWVGKASVEEMSRGWSDFLAGKLLLEADEFDIGNRKELNRLYKLWVGNEFLDITKRHVGSFIVPNTVNHIMTTNEVQPIYLDRNDRRHTIVHTSNDTARNALPAAFHAMNPEAKSRAVRGLAAILTTINIDDRLISKPFQTDHRALLMAWSAPAVERWFSATDIEWIVDDRRGAQSLFETFRLWAEANDRRAADHVGNVIAFGKEMSKLEALGYVQKGKSNCSIYRKLKYYDLETANILATKRKDPTAIWDFVRRMTDSEALHI